MDGGHPRRLGDLGLCHWQIESLGFSEPRSFASSNELAKHVSDAGPGIALPNIQHPFPEDRRVDQAIAPQGFADRLSLPR